MVVPLCPGLGPEQLVSCRKPERCLPSPWKSGARLGWASATPVLSPPGQLAQAGATAGGAGGLWLDQLEPASWPEKPQPSSESIPLSGQGLGGVL